eukprot:CAMPEP_0168356426 /NCGR_PEP_ID=MMETSP0228-20121227/25_1 /TAXON_ID=133427 /ORGANISM="Protoceratium reticulatum, Strain CCCM 535 (=CCMP 1889)" /LENGTH=61 /DNA_ID=CAMNT_0008368833 /DNA_START=307 /DNA_END=489 /DNA_ORIENTATION=+
MRDGSAAGQRCGPSSEMVAASTAARRVPDGGTNVVCEELLQIALALGLPRTRMSVDPPGCL